MEEQKLPPVDVVVDAVSAKEGKAMEATVAAVADKVSMVEIVTPKVEESIRE